METMPPHNPPFADVRDSAQLMVEADGVVRDHELWEPQRVGSGGLESASTYWIGELQALSATGFTLPLSSFD